MINFPLDIIKYFILNEHTVNCLKTLNHFNLEIKNIKQFFKNIIIEILLSLYKDDEDFEEYNNGVSYFILHLVFKYQEVEEKINSIDEKVIIVC